MTSQFFGEIRKTAAAAAEAIYRLSQANGFDSALKFKIRERTLEVLRQSASLESYLNPDRRREALGILYAEAAGAAELVSFAEKAQLISKENSGKVIGAYERIRKNVMEEAALAEEVREDNSFLPGDPRIVAKESFESWIDDEEPSDVSPLMPESSRGNGKDVGVQKSENIVFDMVNAEDRQADDESEKFSGQHQIPEDIKYISDRRKKIMAILKNKGRAQIGEMAALFDSEISEKTLQRDLLLLVNTGLVRKEGDNRWTTYIYQGE